MYLCYSGAGSQNDDDRIQKTVANFIKEFNEPDKPIEAPVEKATSPCRFCLDATVIPELEGCDLSYHTIGESDKSHRLMLRSGGGRQLEIQSEKWTETGNGFGQWQLTAYYRPKFCPECGRRLRRN